MLFIRDRDRQESCRLSIQWHACAAGFLVVPSARVAPRSSPLSGPLLQRAYHALPIPHNLIAWNHPSKSQPRRFPAPVNKPPALSNEVFTNCFQAKQLDVPATTKIEGCHSFQSHPEADTPTHGHSSMVRDLAVWALSWRSEGWIMPQHVGQPTRGSRGSWTDTLSSHAPLDCANPGEGSAYIYPPHSDSSIVVQGDRGLPVFSAPSVSLNACHTDFSLLSNSYTPLSTETSASYLVDPDSGGEIQAGQPPYASFPLGSTSDFESYETLALGGVGAFDVTGVFGELGDTGYSTLADQAGVRASSL